MSLKVGQYVTLKIWYDYLSRSIGFTLNTRLGHENFVIGMCMSPQCQLSYETGELCTVTSPDQYLISNGSQDNFVIYKVNLS